MHSGPVGGLTDRQLSLAACAVGLMWCIGAIELSAPKPERVGLLLYGVVLLWLGVRGWGIGPSVGLYAVVIGGIERLTREPLKDGSDVLRATREAIEVILSGGNPYTHTLLTTNPVGSPFVYPPGEPLFYMPAYLVVGQILRVESWAGILTAAAIVVLGLRVGWGRAALLAMLYAVWGIAAFRTVDGGNDVAAAFLVVVALLGLAFTGPDRTGRIAFLVSAVAFGWALAFKQFAILLWPVILRHLATVNAGWRRYALVSAGVAAAFVIPFLLMSPAAFVEKMFLALTFHENVWGANVLAVLQQRGDVSRFLRPFFIAETLGTILLLAVVLRSRISTIGAAALMGSVLLVIPLVLSRWTTQSYYVYVATIALVGVLLIDERAHATGLEAEARPQAISLHVAEAPAMPEAASSAAVTTQATSR